MSETTLVVSESAQEEIQAAKRFKNKKEVRATLATEINEAYASYIQSNDEIFALALTIENRRIRLGALLHEAKEVVGHGRFYKWLEESCPNISDRSAVRYMAFAKVAGYKELESIHNMTEYQKVLVNLGLREPTASTGVQQLNDYNGFALFTKTCMTAVQKITEIFEKQPLEEFEDDAREQLKAQLEPLVNIYERL